MTSTPTDCFPYENPCGPGHNIYYKAVGITPSVTTVTTNVGKQYYIGIRHADKLKDFCCKVDPNGNLQIKANYMSGVSDKTKDVNGTDLIKYEQVVFPAGKFGELIISPDSTVLIKINDVKSSSNKSNQLCIRLENRQDALPGSNKKAFTFSFKNPNEKEKNTAAVNEKKEPGFFEKYKWCLIVIGIIFVAEIIFLIRRGLYVSNKSKRVRFY
jgi:hypothetical protein